MYREENNFWDNLESHVIPGFCYSPVDETCDIHSEYDDSVTNVRTDYHLIGEPMLIQGQRKLNGTADASSLLFRSFHPRAVD